MFTKDQMVLSVFSCLVMNIVHFLASLNIVYVSPVVQNHNFLKAVSRDSLKVGWAKMVLLAVAASISPAKAMETIAINSSAIGEKISPSQDKALFICIECKNTKISFMGMGKRQTA